MASYFPFYHKVTSFTCLIIVCFYLFIICLKLFGSLPYHEGAYRGLHRYLLPLAHSILLKLNEYSHQNLWHGKECINLQAKQRCQVLLWTWCHRHHALAWGRCSQDDGFPPNAGQKVQFRIHDTRDPFPHMLMLSLQDTSWQTLSKISWLKLMKN